MSVLLHHCCSVPLPIFIPYHGYIDAMLAHIYDLLVVQTASCSMCVMFSLKLKSSDTYSSFLNIILVAWLHKL